MMFASNFSITSEMLVKHFAILHTFDIEHPPTRNTTAAVSANLPAK